MEERKYYGFKDILKFLSFDYEFEKPIQIDFQNLNGLNKNS